MTARRFPPPWTVEKKMAVCTNVVVQHVSSGDRQPYLKIVLRFT